MVAIHPVDLGLRAFRGLNWRCLDGLCPQVDLIDNGESSRQRICVWVWNYSFHRCRKLTVFCDRFPLIILGEMCSSCVRPIL